MSLLPVDAEQIELEGATVPFYKYEKDGVKYLQFDSSMTGHPEPMVNAMVGLQSLGEGESLVMINSKPPMGLFPKVENQFDFSHEEVAPGKVRVVFTPKANPTATTDFTDTACNG